MPHRCMTDCAPGYRGPRCELCNGTSTYDQYFEKLNARCHDCDSVFALASSVFGSLFVVVLLFGAISVSEQRRTKVSLCAKARAQMLKLVRAGRRIWRRAGMRYRIKTIVGLYQCIAAVPSVFDVTTPSGLEHFTQWLDLIEFPALLGVDIIVPSACLGPFKNRLLITCCWPLGLLLLAACASIGWEIAAAHVHQSDRDLGTTSRLYTHSVGAIVRAGLERILPLTLLVTFLLVPSTATRIFKTFLCDGFEYDHAASITRRYLHDDLTLGCDDGEYGTASTIAVAMIGVWPIGTPLLYSLVLLASRRAILSGTPDSLSRATDFLWSDYKRTAWWWEPIEMCRKLTLTGELPDAAHS